MRLATLLLIAASIAATSIAAASQPAALNVKAPELTGGPWINTQGKDLRLSERAGKVTVVHFWTFLCSNCKANLPVYQRWHERFAPRDVAVIGIHSPEFDTEKPPSAVEKYTHKYGITYPVLVDSEMANWRRWNQQFWPVVYLIDKRGSVRYVWTGELNYGGAGGEAAMARRIEELLAE